MAVGMLNGTHLTVTAGSARPAAVPADYWRPTDGVAVAGGLRQHTAGRLW
jgi:hypothetical protein